MATIPRRIYLITQRWRDYPPSACFVWPADELVTQFIDVDVGVNVQIENKLPQWRYRVASGLQATTAFVATDDTVEYTPGYYEARRWCGAAQKWAGYRGDGDLFQGHTACWAQPALASTNIDPETSDQALMYAVKNARAKQTHFRGGNFLAELRDTIRGLRNPVKGIRNLLDTYHSNARKRVKNAVGRRQLPTTQKAFRDLEKDSPDVARAAQKALSDSWLEANFGWAPLVSDAVSAYHALRSLSTKVPRERFHGYATRQSNPTFWSGNRTYIGIDVQFRARTYTEFEVHYYGAVKIESSTPSSTVIEEFGVRARDFLPAVWEAIPYSFLVDYFSNIGEIIEAVSFPKSDLCWMARTFRNHSIRSSDRVAAVNISPPLPGAYTDIVSFKPPRVKWARKYVSRNGYTGSLIPTIRFEIPGSKNWRKWCNVAALARLRTL